MADHVPHQDPARPEKSVIPEFLAPSTDASGDLPTIDHSTPDSDASTFPRAEDRYLIEGKLGEGGMGTVYKAQDRRLDRTVAMKVVRPDAMSDTMRARFEAEACAVARLDHPHIVKVFDVGETTLLGESAPVPFLTLEFIEGGSLAKRLGHQTLTPAEAAGVVARLARAIGEWETAVPERPDGEWFADARGGCIQSAAAKLSGVACAPEWRGLEDVAGRQDGVGGRQQGDVFRDGGSGRGSGDGAGSARHAAAGGVVSGIA